MSTQDAHTIVFRFPGRRYHATPWGHHANEGLIEWPPSPWRLLRALLATGYASLGWGADGPPEVARSLIEKLAAVLPHYRLPAAAGAHSRHYMPAARFENGREKPTLVFDTWARVDSELAVTWNVELTKGEREQLVKLAERMSYLGRSESWVDARLAAQNEILPPGTECLPCDGVPMPGPGWEQVPLLAAQPVEAYAAWRAGALAAELAKLPTQTPSKKRSKKSAGASDNAEAPYPCDLIACLQITTDGLRKHGWSQPPGSRRVFYWRQAHALESGAPRTRPVRRQMPPVEAMLLVMATATRNDHALPSVTRTLPLAERLHAQVTAQVTRYLNGHNNPALTGCDDDRKPLRLPHTHAHILPLDLDGDGHLEHILIWAPMGLDAEAQRAVRNLRQTYTKGSPGPIQLALVGVGSLRDLAAQLPAPPGSGLRVLPALMGHADGAMVWRSLTPFVPPRHLKTSGRHTLVGQVAAELASRRLPAPAAVHKIGPRETREALQMRHFVRNRRFGPTAPIDCGFVLELHFDQCVSGPICLGYGSHFGLGLFYAVKA